MIGRPFSAIVDKKKTGFKEDAMIRKGKKEDIDRIEEIYSKLFSWQDKGERTFGWIHGTYPTRETAETALEAGELFVLEEGGAVVASAKINGEQGEEYKRAAWKHPEASGSQIMVLHTLAVDPDCSGRGYGSEFVKFYEKYALENNCPYLRMDTMAVNRAARRLYSRLGYEEADIVACTFNGIPNVQLVCLEKVLEYD